MIDIDDPGIDLGTSYLVVLQTNDEERKKDHTLHHREQVC